ncbi:MAG: S9 family peptidase [Bacteroidales bacterium]|nr:S9 family peptidase [Bacteroidales bacterium]
MKNFLLILILYCGFLFISQTSWSQNANIISYGIPDSILSGSLPNIEKYKNSTSSPQFIDWGVNGETLLFIRDSFLLKMKKEGGDIAARWETDQLHGAYLSPDQKKFIWTEDQDGDENYQLLLYDISSQKSFPISEKGKKSYDPFWSSNSEKIAFKSNLIDASVVDLFVSDLKDSTVKTMVFRNITDDGFVLDWDIKTDRMLVVKVISENDKQLYLINLKSGATEQVNPGAKEIAYSDAQFIPGKNAAFIVTDKDSEFLQLQYYNFETEKFRNITSEIPWDIDELSIHKNGKRAAFTVNKNGISILYLLDINLLSYEEIEGIPNGVVRNLKFNQGDELAFSLLGDTFKRKTYLYNLNEKQLNHWNYLDNVLTDSVVFVEAQSFNYPSKDVQTGIIHSIPCFIYRPVEKVNSICPVLIDIHGGPEDQALPVFNPFRQFLVNELKIAVVVPNVRGSNGYGKSFMKADDWMKREKAVEDIGALLDWIENQEDLDHTRISVYGGSYGGYMVLASLAHFPERIKCGIDVVGISNWINFMENTSDYRRDLRRVEYGDERIPEVRKFMKEISPVNNAWKIQSPLLIFQGLNDPRVHYKESEQIFHLLNNQGKVIWYLMATDEGHGFRKDDNLNLQRNIEVSFLREYLFK